jgi:Holliday junction resolvase RusA-like endonuclease
MGDQLGLFAGDDNRRHIEMVEREKSVISAYEAQRVQATEFWAVLRDPRPVSINKAYSGVGNRFLTAEGRNFEDKLKAATAAALGTQPIAWKHVVDAVYKQGGHIDLTIWLYMEDLLNRAWQVGGSMTVPKKPKAGKKAAKPQPRSPYQKKDGSNYIKLIEDAVVKGTGIDDSAHLDVAIKKREDRLDPRIVLVYKVYE